MNFSSQERKYLGIIGAIILGLFLMEYNRPKPINWQKTFSKTDKIPYGGIVLYELLPELFEGQEVVPNRKTFYEWEEQGELSDISSIILINDRVNFSEYEGEVLSEWVRNGGKMFIAASEFPGLVDSLGIDISGGFFFPFFNEQKKDGLDSADIHNFTNPALKSNEGFLFKYGTADHYFTNFESEYPITVLAMNGVDRPTFIKVEYGGGEIYWNANPLLFTNYTALLGQNHQYIAGAMSYLPPDGKVLWDEYYKVGRTGSRSQLRVVLSKPSLAWGWYLSLIAIAVFIMFNVKRRQRVIPIVEPPRNTTIEFTDTVGRLYLEYRDHSGLARKMKSHFKDHIRRQLYLQLDELQTPEEAKKLAEKAGLDYDWIKRLFRLFQAVIDSPKPTDQQLIDLQKGVEYFYAEVGIKRIG